MNQNEKDFKVSLAGLLDVVKKSILGMIITGLILGGTVGIISKKFVDPKYSAKSALYVVSASDSILKIADLELGSSITSDYIYLITSRPFITEMKNRLGLGSEYTYARLKSMITVTNPKNTHTIEITTVSKDDKLAADISNALAEISVTRIADIMESSHPKIIENAAARGYQVSPNSTLNAIISFILGAILFFIAKYISVASDNTVKSIEDVDMQLGLNILGVVNEATDKRKPSRKKGDKGGKYE